MGDKLVRGERGSMRPVSRVLWFWTESREAHPQEKGGETRWYLSHCESFLDKNGKIQLMKQI